MIDSCVPRQPAQLLRELGHDVAEIAAEPPDPGDVEVLARARRERRMLVNRDNDFGKLVFLQGAPMPASSGW